MTKNSKRGFALAIVLVLMLLVSLLGSSILMLVNNHYKLTEHLIDSTKAFYLTEGGVHAAIFKIRNEENPAYDGNWDFPGTGTLIHIVIDTTDAPAPNYNYTVTATTDSSTSPGNVVRRIQVVVNRPDPFTLPDDVTITSWWEIIE